MKNLLKSLALVAVSALAVVSCQKNELAGGNDGEGVFFSLRTADAGKTYIVANDGKYLPMWSEGDEIGVLFDEFKKDKKTPAGTLKNTNESGATAKFEGTITGAPDEGTLYAFYPASAIGTTYDNQSIGFDMPSIQHPTATSFDPAADILVAKPVDFLAEDGFVAVGNMYFARILATLKVNLNSDFADVKNQKVSSFKLEATEAILSGRAAVSMIAADGKITDWNTKNKVVSATYDETSTVAVAGSDKSVFVTINPKTITAGETITFTIETEGYIITKAIALTSDIVLTPGNLTEINLGIAEENCEQKQDVDYSGEYLIVSGEYLLTDYNSSSKYYNYVKADGAELSDFWKVAGIENYVWTVTKLADGSYSFCNAGSGKYLAFTGSTNNAYEATEPGESTAMNIKKESDASLTVYSKQVEGRNLRYNTSSPRFAFYSGTTTGTAATLLKYTSDPRPKFDAVSGLSWDASSKTLSWTAVEGATNGYEYTTDNGTSIVAVESNSVDCSSWTNGDYSVKVRVVGTDAKKTSEWSSACEFTISGGAAAKYYRKVTEDLGDWTGTYLIVSGSSAANGTITSSWLGYITVNADTDNKILSDTNTDAVAVTIEETEDDGNYTIQFANGKYLGTTDSNGGIKVADSAGNDFKWKFSFKEGLVKIENTIKEDRHLRLNGTSGFRTYTSTTGTQATLYKLDEVAVTSITVSGTPTKTAYKAGDDFETAGLIATATYEDASEKDVTDVVEWAVTPTPLTAGTTSVSVVATYKKVSSEAYVVNGITVTEAAELTSISVKTAPTKVTYKEGDNFDPAGLVITRNYSDATSDDYAYAGHESEFTFSPALAAPLTTTNNKVTITYKEKSVDQEITVDDTSLKTMDEIFAAATKAGNTATSVKIKFTDCVVTGVKNSNAYLTDANGTKGLIIYTSSHGFEVGDKLNGKVDCKVQLYNGSAELTELKSTTTGLTVTKDGIVTPQTISIANLSGVNTGAVISFSKLSYDGANFTDGTNSLQPYYTFMTLPTFDKAKKYNITGVFIQFKTTKEIAPRTEADIEEIEVPYIKATPSKTSVAADGETISVTVETNVASWTVESSDPTNFAISGKAASSFNVVVAENTDTQNDREATITVKAEGAENAVFTLKQVKKGGSTRPAVGTELFYCDFGKTAIALASYTGGRSYKNESTIKYTASDASIVKITTDNATNMTSGNLYFNTKNAGAGYSATISGIKTHGVSKVKVIWAANNDYTTVTVLGSDTAGVKSAKSASNQATFELKSGVETLSVVFTSNGKSNTRVDDVKVEVAE